MKSNPGDFVDYRLFYSKTGRAKYISHLDVMRTFQRAFKRSKIDFWYTEGFHPHLYLTFALPLSLGYESLCESVDFRLTAEMDCDEILHRIGDTLPEGFTALRCVRPAMAAKDIRYADYDIAFSCSDADTAEKWKSCFGRDEVTVVKKTKRGETELNLKPLMELGPLEESENGYCFTARLSSGVETNINPELIFDALEEYLEAPVLNVSVLRKAVYDGSLKNFE